MLSFFRSLSKSKFTWVILGIPLVASLLIFGNAGDMLGNITATDAVVKAGGRTIDSAEFQRVFDTVKENAGQRVGRAVTTEEVVAQGGVASVLNDLAGRESLLAILHKIGVRPGDALLAAEIRKVPAFFNPVTGAFDQKLYEQALAQRKLTPAIFEKGAKDELALDHFQSSAAAGLRTPTAYGALVALSQLEERTFSGFYVDPRTVAPPAAPTDAQLQAFIKEYAKQLTKPERRSLTVVRFSAKALEPTIQVDAAEVKRRYDFRKDTLSTPERRTVIQVPAKDAQTAQAVAARLRQGEDPRAVAKSIGTEPVVYTDAPKTAIADPRIAEPAFTLAAGAVSPPVQGALGPAVIKVMSVTPGRAVTFEEVAPAIAAEARAELAKDKIYDVTDAYTRAHEGGASLKEAARAANVTALELPPVTAQGVDAQGRPQPMLSPAILKAAFELPEGAESDIVSESTGESFAVRVEKVFPPALPSIAQEREGLTRAYMQLETARRVRAHIDALVARINKGESMTAVAASQGAKLERVTIDLRSAQADQSPRRQLFAAVFSAKKGAVVPASTTIIKVEDVRLTSTAQAGAVARAAAPQMRQQIFNGVLGEAARWARVETKAKVDEARARAALGLQPAGADGEAQTK